MSNLIKNKIKENVSLAPYTTFKIGGPAKYFSEVKNSRQLKQALQWAEEKNLPYFILGGGSNLLVSDKGFKGLVIKCQMSNVKCLPEMLHISKQAGQNQNSKLKTIYTEAGALLSQVVNLAIKNNLTGLEWAAGIPGTVGGAVRGNAGAFSSCIGDVIQEVKFLEIRNSKFEIRNKSQILKSKAQNYNFKFKTLKKKDCQFSYRNSIFKKSSCLIILETKFKLEKEKKDVIIKKIKKYLSCRSETQPKLPSAGCVFKNLTVTNLKKSNANLANKAQKEGIVKRGVVGAGWLISQLGLRGKTMGGAQISSEHANFIVNTGKATAEDVIKLISDIKQQVRDKFKIQLEEEIQYLGF